MKQPSRSLSVPVAILAAALALSANVSAQEKIPLDVRDMQAAEQLSNEGKYDEALKIYDSISKNYPTSAYIPGANLGAAVSNYFLKDYDKAAAAAERNTKLGTPPAPEILEQSYVLLPQIYLAKAASLPEGDQLRTKSLQDAIKAFDDVVAKFPNGDEVETALYGKGRAQMLLSQFDAGVETFRANLARFPKSPSALDSQYLLAFALYLKGAKALQAQTKEDTTIIPSFAEADKLLREIADKRSDLALINRSTFLLGDVLAARAAATPKEGDQQDTIMKTALAVYRNVAPKEVVLQAQEARINYFRALAAQGAKKGDMQAYRKNNRLVEKEREKLEVIKDEPDQSIQAKIKSGQIFVGLGKFDEARVLLHFVEPFVPDTPEGKEQEKQIKYFLTVSYAAQHIADKALEHYKAFNAAYKDDPLGENLPLLMGGVYLDPNPSINDPQKAITYFDEQIKRYPESRFSAEAVVQKANALVQQGKFDEATKALKDFIAKNKNPELLAQAEFSLAVVYSQTGKNADAVAGFKAVRDKFPNSEQAQQASFFIGQILYSSGDAKTALTELDAFVAKFPQSELVPQALYFKARALSALDKNEESRAAYAKVASEFPQSPVAVPSFFERAIMLRDEGKSDEAIAVMKEFAEKFPDSPQVFQAFEFIAQIHIKDQKVEEAIKTYESYIASHADNPTSAKAFVAIAKLQEKQANDIGPYLVIAAKDKPAWEAYIQKAIKTAETAIEKYPDSDTVAAAVELLLDLQRSMQVTDPSRTEEAKDAEMKEYFTNLTKKYEGTPAKAKISFGYAALVANRNEDSAFETMNSAYNPEAIFSPEDLDLYGKMLIARKQYDDAEKIAAKLVKDYPVAPNTPPEKVTRTIGTAQSIAMALRADILRANGKAAEGQKILEKLKSDYPWSPKVAEADFGIAAGLFEQQKYDEAVKLLTNVAREINGPVPLRAKAMMMTAKALEAQKKYGEAINNYTKISAFFQSEGDLAAEGLWRGAQLQEKQGTGEIPMPEPAAKKPAAKEKGDSKKTDKAQTDGDKKAPKKP